MSRCRKRKRKQKGIEPTVTGPFSGTYWHLRRLARGLNLFVLFDGNPAAPRLTFFDTTRGMPLLNYWPKSGLWAYADRPGRGGRCNEHGDSLAVAQRLAGSIGAADRNWDKSQFGAPE